MSARLVPWSRWTAVAVATLLAVSVLAAAPPTAPAPVVLDDFETLAGWQAAPADGVAATIAVDAGTSGRGLRLDYDFQGRAGWAIARRRLDLELAANWRFELAVRGTPATQNLEIKLLDASGDNVWWLVRRDFRFTGEWQRLLIPKQRVSFAWGPAGGGELARLGALEIAVVAGDGGAGSVWIDDLSYTPLPPAQPYAGVPVATASLFVPGAEPARALDGDPATAWRATAGAWLAVDFGERRELGGLTIDWDGSQSPASFAVELSDDGVAWTEAWRVDAARDERSWVPLPEAACRHVRLRVVPASPAGIGIRELAVLAPAVGATPNDFMAAVAQAARRGLFPRGMRGEMSAWTVVGPPDGGARALLGADGAFEPVAWAGSLEPFVALDGALVTWADVTSEQTLLDGRLPIPTVTWTAPAFTLAVTAVAEPETALLRYRLTNRTEASLAPLLLLAARPFQVNPPSQFLNGPGGVASPAAVVCEAAGLRVGEAWRATASPSPERCGAAGFDGGDVVSLFAAGSFPLAAETAVGQYASGALAWQPSVAPGATAEVAVTISRDVATTAAADLGGDPETRLEAVAAAWRERLARVGLTVPPAGRGVVDTLAANVAFMLVNRDGAALEPGARAYARSWIRDGAMMAAALLRLGHGAEVKAYARWFAGFQYPDGRVPCCVDRRGADPVPENDADGELIFLVAETWRLTGDAAFAAELWPQVARAADHIDLLRAARRGDEFRTPEQLVFFGLVPESISHEGYSAKPRHSYWDDLWAWRGLADAAELAAALGLAVPAAHYTASAAELRGDLVASLERAMRQHEIDYLPGCAELGDFDPTSTTVAVAPTAADRFLPAGALRATFERAWDSFVARRDGAVEWQAYTPYELRQVGVFIRLGWRERAWQLLDYYLGDLQPVGWRQWPEIVWRDRGPARFLGDLPHSWVGSDFVRAVLDAFAWERERDQALVVGAGLPATWLDGDGVAVTGLRTRWGPLSYRLRRDGEVVRFSLTGGLAVPAGGVVLQPPLASPPQAVTVDGRPSALTDAAEIVIRVVPAEVVIRVAGQGGAE